MDGKAAACVRCGANVAPGSAACPQCGFAKSFTPSSPFFPTQDTQKKGVPSGSRAPNDATEDAAALPSVAAQLAAEAERAADEFHIPPPTSGEERYRVGQQILGHYTVVKQLGRGGMGTVYLARDDVSGQEVAVKVLPAALARERDIRERFVQEARALATMDHPNIVPLVTFAQEGEDRYLVMKYLAGESLDARLRRTGVLAPEHARKVLRAVLSALGYAHARGVIHRDVKPSNVIIEGDLDGEQHRVFLVDFGIAKKEMGGERLTQTGMLMGTPQYMSPEQISGHPVDGRSDLYAAGLVLFEMLSGRPPFDGQKTFQVLRAHVEQPVPDVREARGSEVPEDLVAVVYILLRKDPEERPRDAVEAIGLLDGTGSFPVLKPDEKRLTPSTVSVRPPSLETPRASSASSTSALTATKPHFMTDQGGVDDSDLNDPSAEELATVRRRGPLFAATLFIMAAAVAAAVVWKPWTLLPADISAGGADSGVSNASHEKPVDDAAMLLLIQTARTAFKGGDAMKAYNAIEAAVDRAPDNVDARSLQVDVRTAAGMLDDADNALAELKALLATKPDADATAKLPAQEQAIETKRADIAAAQAEKERVEKEKAEKAEKAKPTPKKLVSDASLKKAAANTKWAVGQCFQDLQRRVDKSASGEATVMVRFNAGGTVEKADVTSWKGKAFGNKKFQSCVEGEIKKWRVPGWKGDQPTATTSYTIDFHP